MSQDEAVSDDERLQILAEEAQETGDFSALEAAVIERIEQSTGADEIRHILSLEPLDAALFGEAEFPPSIAEALLTKAESSRDLEQAANGIALALRAAAFDPTVIVLRTLDHTVKDTFAQAIEAQIELFRAGLSSPHAALRTAHAHALGRCRNATPADASALLASARAETESAPLATFLLSFGAIVRRLPELAQGAAEGRALLVEHLGHPSTLVRACAASALALTGARLSAPATAALAEAITAAVPLPEPWGWDPQAMSTMVLAVRVLSWAETDTPTLALQALAQLEATPWLIAEPFVHLAFADGAAIPALGVALEELSDDQKLAVSAFAKLERAHDTLNRFGLGHPRFVLPFLAGEGALWKPVAIETPTGLHHWHLTRIFREHMWADLPRDVAADAITRALDPAELVDAMCTRWRGVLLQIKDLPRGPLQNERDQGLVAAVIERLLARGFDPRPQLIDHARVPGKWPNEWDDDTLTTCLLATEAAGGEPLPEDLDPFLAQGIARARSSETHTALLAPLSPDRHRALRARLAPPRA